MWENTLFQISLKLKNPLKRFFLNSFIELFCHECKFLRLKLIVNCTFVTFKNFESNFLDF